MNSAVDIQERLEDHSILECYNLFSGVELSMRSFFVIFVVLLVIAECNIFSYVVFFSNVVVLLVIAECNIFSYVVFFSNVVVLLVVAECNIFSYVFIF